MTVLTTSVNVSGITPLTKAVIRVKPIPETRPVTATLECPAILDITFLKKLDMTSFTKKGLIAISKICGISLIKRTDDKKIRKRLKRHTVERVKKEARTKSLHSESSDEPANPKQKWTGPKTVAKIKVPDVSVNRTRIEGKSIGPRVKGKEVKPSVDDILYGPVEIVVTEPCKTCGRSEHPERFHSHPKQAPGKKINATAVPPREKLVPPLPKTRRHSTGHLQSEHLSVSDLDVTFHSDHEIETKKILPETKSLRQSFNRNKNGAGQKPSELPRSKAVLKPKKTNQSGTLFPEDKTSASQEDMKYVTGCYVCGKQMSHEIRFSHEEECIAEWRKQNSQLPPDERKAEPLRPDFRFTESGNVDFEGTFKSIWANHMDSLVPCAKCKRTFFPERIERHQACCNKQTLKQKNSTPRNK